jgi:hypothetical protein
MFTSTAGIISLSADKGSSIQSLKVGSTVDISTSHAISSATTIEALGADSQVKVIAGTGLTVLEGAAIVARSERAKITLQALGKPASGGQGAVPGYIHLNSGSAVTSGARFDIQGATPVPVKTGTDATLEIRTNGELNIAGSVTAAGTLTIQSGKTVSDYADYFDTLPGRTLDTLGGADLAAALAGLNSGTIMITPALSAMLQGAKVGLGASPSVISLANFAPFSGLSTEAKAAVAASLGYTVYKDGGHYRPETDTFRATLTGGAVLREADGYTRQNPNAQGLVFYKADAPAGQQVRATFVQGTLSDYSNASINWAAAGVTAPAAEASFKDLTATQKRVVAVSLGYTFDYSAIPLATWGSLPFDYAQVSLQEWIDASTLDFRNTLSDSQWGNVPRPATGTPYAMLSPAQKALVDRHVEFSPLQVDRLTLTGTFAAGDKFGLTINGTRVEVTVAAADIGVDAAATRAAVAQKLATAVNASAVAVQVTAQADGDLLRVRSDQGLSTSTPFTLVLDANEERVQQSRGGRLGFDKLNFDQQLLVVGKLRPAMDARWENLSLQQRDVVIAYIDGPDTVTQGGQTLPVAKTFFKYDAAPGKRTVTIAGPGQPPTTTLVQGLATDYSNAHIHWGSLAAPGADAAFATLTADQQRVVAKALGYEVYQGAVWFKAGAPEAQRLATQVVTGTPADFSLELIDWDGVSEPARKQVGGVWREASFEELTLGQQQAVARHLGYEAARGTFFVKAGAEAGRRILPLLVEGGDYRNAQVDWGNVSRPAEGTRFEALSLEQQQRVLQSSGYARWEGVVYVNDKATPAQKYRLGFEQGAGKDYENDKVTWSRVDVPALTQRVSLAGVATVETGKDYTIDIGGSEYTVTAKSGDTVVQLVAALVAKVNEGAAHGAAVDATDTGRLLVNDGPGRAKITFRTTAASGTAEEGSIMIFIRSHTRRMACMISLSLTVMIE